MAGSSNEEPAGSVGSQSGGEHYVKTFDMWTHLLVMLYAVIMRFDSLREIAASALANVSRLPKTESQPRFLIYDFPLPQRRAIMHLSQEQRYQISAMIKVGRTQKAIATAIGVSGADKKD